MNKTEFDKVISEYSFSKIGDIRLINNELKFNNIVNYKTHGHVYLWVEKKENDYVIVYVGKAGKTINARCQQHSTGFKKSTTGKKHAARLIKGFNSGYSYELYARKSKSESICDEHQIPMECVEEIAFIKKFSPAWNAI